jgi:hypothetical protein
MKGKRTLVGMRIEDLGISIICCVAYDSRLLCPLRPSPWPSSHEGDKNIIEVLE